MNPTGAANFVNKVKNIPQTISDFFHRKSDGKKISIESDNTVLSWDITTTNEWWLDKPVIENKNEQVGNTKNTEKDNKSNEKEWDSIDDFVWLERLNEETNSLLWIKTGDKKTETKVVVVSTWCDNDKCEKIEQELKDLAKQVDELKKTISISNKTGTSTWEITVTEIKIENTWNLVQDTTPVQNQNNTNPSNTTKATTKKRTNCCDANCVLSQSECAEANMIWNLFQ